MAQCKRCGKSGWFLSVSPDGLCEKRERTASEEAKNRAQLKPASLSDYVGQDLIKQDLQSKIALAKKNGSPLPHMLLCGPNEMGKATLTRAIAGETESGIKCSHAKVIKTPKDLAKLLSELREQDLCLIEEIESLSAPVVEVLIPALEDFILHLVIGTGPSEQTYRLKLPKFTLVSLQ